MSRRIIILGPSEEWYVVGRLLTVLGFDPNDASFIRTIELVIGLREAKFYNEPEKEERL